MLLVETLLRLSGPKLVQLTNVDNTGGLRASALAGTVALTSGGTVVVGAGTAFTSFQGAVNAFGGIVIQFASQPGVNYVVIAVADDTHLTLAKPYGSTTTASTTAVLPGINYTTLQQAVFDAQGRFQDRTNLVFDDVTNNVANPGANPTLNRDLWAGVALVTAFLYEPGRGNPWPDAEVDAAWSIADKRLNVILHTRGDGAFSPPVTDSVFNPSVGPTRLPNMDNERWGGISPLDPGPGPSDVPSGGGADGWGW